MGSKINDAVVVWNHQQTAASGTALDESCPHRTDQRGESKRRKKMAALDFSGRNKKQEPSKASLDVTFTSLQGEKNSNDKKKRSASLMISFEQRKSSWNWR
uniref:Uncharacterized protein n=1 Tax=Oryza brachyantha TaxID=4533 RepID=J3LD37_ORYBR